MDFKLRTFGLVLAVLSVLGGCRREPAGTMLGETYKQIAQPEIWQVQPGSQADEDGLKPGDLIVSYASQPVLTNDDLRRLQSLERAGTAAVPLTVLRDEKEIDLSVAPGPLGVMLLASKYPSSLAVALQDIMSHFGMFGDYDWLAALTGESFTFTANAGERPDLWPGGKSGTYLADLGRTAGLAFRAVYGAHEGGEASSTGFPGESHDAIRGALMRNEVVLVHGGWPAHRSEFWGIATRYDLKDSTVHGYSLDSAGELPLVGPVGEAYVVRPAGQWADQERLLATALKQALELNQARTATGWKSGIDAYDLLIVSLDTVPFCAGIGPEEGQACFDRLVRATMAHKESANRFLEGMKLALPDRVGLLDDAIADNEAIIGKLDGILASGARLGVLDDQRKLAMVFNQIQFDETDLIDVYDQLLGALYS